MEFIQIFFLSFSHYANTNFLDTQKTRLETRHKSGVHRKHGRKKSTYNKYRKNGKNVTLQLILWILF